MIISHKYKYLFVELPQTGTTAINRELQEHYDGQEILHRHATYREFLKVANGLQKSYFVFSTIRDPIDNAVSTYFKCKTDHHGTYSAVRNRPLFSRLIFRNRTRGLDFMQSTNADFSTYFLKFYRLPYDNWSAISHHRFDFIMRFERLGKDFPRALEMIGLKEVRPLPIFHTTGEKRSNYASYYTPEAIERAKHVFGPFMEKWGYRLPHGWGEHEVSWLDRLQYRLLGGFRKSYWSYLRPYVQARLYYERNDYATAEKIMDGIRKNPL